MALEPLYSTASPKETEKCVSKVRFLVALKTFSALLTAHFTLFYYYFMRQLTSAGCFMFLFLGIDLLTSKRRRQWD